MDYLAESPLKNIGIFLDIHIVYTFYIQGKKNRSSNSVKKCQILFMKSNSSITKNTVLLLNQHSVYILITLASHS